MGLRRGCIDYNPSIQKTEVGGRITVLCKPKVCSRNSPLKRGSRLTIHPMFKFYNHFYREKILACFNKMKCHFSVFLKQGCQHAALATFSVASGN